MDYVCKLCGGMVDSDSACKCEQKSDTSDSDYCAVCHGTGYKDGKTCMNCYGSGCTGFAPPYDCNDYMELFCE